MGWLDIFGIYLVVINLIGIFVMWDDKRRARKGRWRIPERTLFFAALLGGAFGTTFGMFKFRHKTKHWYFKYGMPAIALLWAVVLVKLILF